MKKIFTLSFSLILSIHAISQNIVFVKNSATGTENGTSWNNAYRNLKTAIENAPANSEIWISIWTSESDAQTSTKEEYLTIDKPLKLYGGFFGTESNKNERSKSSYTRISGKLVNGDVAYHAFRIQSPNVVLNRFQIRNFDSKATPSLMAGVIIVDSLASLTLSESILENNQGLCLSLKPKSNTKLISCTFDKNNDIVHNHIIWRMDDSKLDMESCIFSNNGDGGYLIYEIKTPSFQTTPEVQSDTLLKVRKSNFISNNMAVSYNYFGSASFTNCLFTLNQGSYGNTFNHTSDGNASLLMDQCTFNGTYSSYFIYANTLKNFFFTNCNLTNPSNSDLYFYTSNIQNTKIINSNFYDINGSQPFYFYSPNGKLSIENTTFDGGIASNQLLYVSVPKFEFTNSKIKNLSPLWGSYLSCDTILVQNSTFDNLNSYYIFQHYSASKVTYDNCMFTNNYLQETLFRNDQTDLTVKNCVIDNLSAPMKNPSRPLLFYTSMNRKLTVENCKFSNITTDKTIALNYGKMTLFGNMFTNFSTDTTFFMNYDSLKLYNCNLNIGNNLFSRSDTSYKSLNVVSLEIINSVVYSDQTKLLENMAPLARYSEKISHSVSNQDFSSNLGFSKSNLAYQDFYLDETPYDLFDLGVEIPNYAFPLLDVQGNQRVKFSAVDIGAIEYQNNITSVSKNQQTFNSSIFPNPISNGQFTVSVDKNSDFQLYDSNGILLLTQRIEKGETQISTADLRSGLYFGKIIQDGASFSHKLIVE